MPVLNIVLNDPETVQQWKIRAVSENAIDFRRDHVAAARCTKAFAALELKTFLEKADSNLSVQIVEKRPARGAFVELTICNRDTGGGFNLTPDGEGLVVSGHGSNGLLNGAYELLRLQGWRWLEPGPYGESAPEHPALNWPQKPVEHVPSFRFRGIDAVRESDDSVELLRWLARNRINVVYRKSATGKFADKLGMYSRKGGHLLQKMMNPDNPMDDGRTIWEAHPEWFGMPADGERRKATATQIQLCISQPALLDYIGNKAMELLDGEMSGIDILDLWGFDTWGKNCCCDGCRDIGNGADQNLALLSHIRDHLNKHLKRRVFMNTIAYEGCVTMEPPAKPVPRNLAEAGDIVIFYPINRCYRHLLGDRDCVVNQLYRESLAGWGAKAQGLSLWAGEYYNVSKYEDLPLVFMRLIPAEMRYYRQHGATGATYMHNFSPNWGVRALTQLQHAQYAWDTGADDEVFLHEYFSRKYAGYAPAMRSIHEKIEDGFGDIAAWRNWRASALSILRRWDGGKPDQEFALPHFPNAQSVLTALRKSVALLDAALAGTRKLVAVEQSVNWKTLPTLKDIASVVAPQELDRIRYYDKLEYRLGEDARGLIYGADTMRLMLAVVEYHDARRCGTDDAAIWARIEALSEKMSDYHVPLNYENPTPGVTACKDALSRTQLRILITRCRGERMNRPGNAAP